jgi:hypothetical protein
MTVFYEHTWQRGVGQRTSLSGSELGFGSLAVTRWAAARSSAVTEHRHASTAGHEVKPKTPANQLEQPTHYIYLMHACQAVGAQEGFGAAGAQQLTHVSRKPQHVALALAAAKGGRAAKHG